MTGSAIAFVSAVMLCYENHECSVVRGERVEQLMGGDDGSGRTRRALLGLLLGRWGDLDAANKEPEPGLEGGVGNGAEDEADGQAGEADEDGGDPGAQAEGRRRGEGACDGRAEE